MTNTTEAALRDALEPTLQAIAETGKIEALDWHNILHVFATRALSQPSPASSTAGEVDYEARYVHGGAPTDCVDYGVVSLSKGKEVCRVWEREDAELIARLLNASLSSSALPASVAGEAER